MRPVSEKDMKSVKMFFYLTLFVWIAFGAETLSAQAKLEMKPKSANPVAVLKYGCLPTNIKPDTIVDARRIESMVGIRIVKESVVQRLDKMKARCKAGKLVDQKGREIRFYQLQNCWGNPPADYLELQERQENDLKELRKKFTVIEITCNPSGLMPF